MESERGPLAQPAVFAFDQLAGTEADGYRAQDGPADVVRVQLGSDRGREDRGLRLVYASRRWGSSDATISPDSGMSRLPVLRLQALALAAVDLFVNLDLRPVTQIEGLPGQTDRLPDPQAGDGENQWMVILDYKPTF